MPSSSPPLHPFIHTQCFLKPTYLRSADGRRMLTYLFGLHPGLVADIHETVKAQLPHVRAVGILVGLVWRIDQ